MRASSELHYVDAGPNQAGLLLDPRVRNHASTYGCWAPAINETT